MLKEQVIKAYNFAKRKHSGQKRAFSKLPYFSHPKYVARLLESLTKKETLIIAGLLHDTLEDTNTTYDEIEKKFGVIVADIVLSLTIDKEQKNKLGKKECLKRKLSNMTDDGFTVKLADRYHNVLFLDRDEVPKSFIEKYYHETIYVFGNLDRHLTEVQKVLLENIFAVIHMIGIKYKLNGGSK